MSLPPDFNPALDLVLQRTLPVPVRKLWRAWTVADHLKQWFCPKPWQITDALIELRPGGAFNFRMQGPDGEGGDNNNCFLEVEHERRLTWTDALTAGYRPVGTPGFLGGFFVGQVNFEPIEGGTRYVAIARHALPEVRDRHEQMGFQEGWGIVADQLVEYCASLTL